MEKPAFSAQVVEYGMLQHYLAHALQEHLKPRTGVNSSNNVQEVSNGIKTLGHANALLVVRFGMGIIAKQIHAYGGKYGT